MQKEPTYIYGKHPVEEALRSRPDVVKRIYFIEGSENESLQKLARSKDVEQKMCNTASMPSAVSRDSVHQGIIAEIMPEKLLQSYDDFIATENITADSAFVILGEVNDPQNVGAIIRSAAAFGARAVMIPEHRQVQVTGTVVKTSAGMAFKIPLISIGNVNQTIEDLKEKGCWVYGLEGGAELELQDEEFEKASVFVLGNEGRGIREKTLEHCDILLKIPIEEKVESLNASVAAGVVLYAWRQKH